MNNKYFLKFSTNHNFEINGVSHSSICFGNLKSSINNNNVFNKKIKFILKTKNTIPLEYLHKFYNNIAKAFKLENVEIKDNYISYSSFSNKFRDLPFIVNKNFKYSIELFPLYLLRVLHEFPCGYNVQYMINFINDYTGNSNNKCKYRCQLKRFIYYYKLNFKGFPGNTGHKFCPKEAKLKTYGDLVKYISKNSNSYSFVNNFFTL